MISNDNIMIRQPINPFHNLLGNNMRNTPTRERQLKSKDKSEYYLNQKEDGRSLSPNKLNATKKPIIKKMAVNGFHKTMQKHSLVQNNQSKIQKNLANQYILNKSGSFLCANHPKKEAQFFVTFENQEMNYCEKCAINLASKGFSISKRTNKFNNRPAQEFHIPELSSKLGYAQIKDLIDKIDEMNEKILKHLFTYENIDKHYDQQYEITDQYYQALLETVQQMREDHLNDLILEKQKHSQLAYIKIGDINEDIKTLETIRGDLTSSIEGILDNFRQQSTQKNLNFYRQEITMNLQDKIEDYNSLAKEFINYQENILKTRLSKVQEYLLEIWNQDSRNFTQSNQDKGKNNKKTAMNFKAPIQKDYMSSNNQQFTACRRLFEDSIELPGQTSPQFKNI